MQSQLPISGLHDGKESLNTSVNQPGHYQACSRMTVADLPWAHSKQRTGSLCASQKKNVKIILKIICV